MAKVQDMNGHTRNNEICTPPALYAWLDRRFQFNYDAFASHENALCGTYSTVDGTFINGEYLNPGDEGWR